MSKLKDDYEYKSIKKSGEISAKALKKAVESIKSGVTGLEIDQLVADTVYAEGGDLSYKTVPNYDWASCITINEQVVHGIPTDKPFKDGDIVSVDLASVYKGWHTDTAWTVLIGSDSEKERFLKAGEEALWLGIKQAVVGNQIGDISHAIQQKIEASGYSVVRSLVGHGVGRNLHEDPEVPGFGKPGTGPKLVEGQTLAIEIIYTQGSHEVILEQDGWTISTADGSWGGLFEMTVIVGKEKAEVLTDWRKL